MQSQRSRARQVTAAPVVARRPTGAPHGAPGHGTVTTRRGPSLRVRRRRAVAVTMCLVVAALGLSALGMSGGSSPATPPPPSTPFRARIVSIAESQLGYHTDPAQTYCNKFSAYWGAGSPCAHGLRAEEWCADFAAWVWRKAGAQFTYGVAPGDLNAAAGSFYSWALAHGTWHPVGSGYTPRAGDVAVYGLQAHTATADHVAVVTGYVAGARGPDVVNGDGDHTGFSVVEPGTDQSKADVPGTTALLAGYASPVRAATQPT